MKLQSEVFQLSGSWASLAAEVTTWVNEHVSREALVSISISESGRNVLDTSDDHCVVLGQLIRAQIGHFIGLRNQDNPATGGCLCSFPMVDPFEVLLSRSY
jgi:hypothetical protein